MPPKARANVMRGPGRPKRTAAPEPVAKTLPAKRGRPAKPATNELAEEPPKKRGRPPKAKAGEEPASLPHTSKTTKHEAPSTPTKRGRPAKTPALSLSRVVAAPRASPRISKQKTIKSNATASRIDPRMRARLRTRLPPAPKALVEEPTRQPAKRGPGRPRKAPVQVQSVVARAKVTKPAKPLAPRKRRGYTMLEVPDRFLAHMKQTLHDLLHADSSDNVSIMEEKPASSISEQVSDMFAQEQGEDALDEQHANVEGEIELDVEEDHQEGHAEDEATEQTPEPSEEVQDELHVQQIVQVEQITVFDDASSIPDASQQLAGHDDYPESLQSRSDSGHDVDAFAPEQENLYV